MTPPQLLSRDELDAIVRRLAAEITATHRDGVVLVGVLKGALIFTADLARAITDIHVEIDFMAISRYAPNSGRVRILKDLEAEIEGRDVVLVEDIVDTGLTVAYLVGQLQARGPRQVEVCTLLDRRVRRIVPLEVRYLGREVPDVYVLGYGLHYADLYRNLADVWEADPDRVRRDPGTYTAELYGRRAGPQGPVVG